MEILLLTVLVAMALIRLKENNRKIEMKMNEEDVSKEIEKVQQSGNAPG